MKKISIVLGMLALSLALAPSARAQTTPATTCPTNYQCSLVTAGAAPLVGEANDGHPRSVIGYVEFDGSGNVTATLEINNNGTIHNVTAGTGTCTSGTATTPAVVQVTTGSGTMMFDFVVARSAASLDLLLSNHTTGTPTNDVPVTNGVCHASAAG